MGSAVWRKGLQIPGAGQAGHFQKDERYETDRRNRWIFPWGLLRLALRVARNGARLRAENAMNAPLGAQEERTWLDAPGVRGLMSRLLVENFDVQPDSLYAQARLDEDLCLDSLELVDFGMMLENQSGIELDVQVLNLAITLGDLADLVEAAQEMHKGGR